MGPENRVERMRAAAWVPDFWTVERDGRTEGRFGSRDDPERAMMKGLPRHRSGSL